VFLGLRGEHAGHLVPVIHVGGGHRTVAVARVVIGGALGLAITYLIGHLFGTAIA
jgi:membrane protein DedA with SNARE-associated domain